MNNQNQNQKEFSYEEMQKALALHIWKNDHLRDEIVKNPKAAIERELNVKLDDSLKINIVNHTDPNQATFILPCNIHKVAGQELSDDQLEDIAGGSNKVSRFVEKHAGIIGQSTGSVIGAGGAAVAVAFGAPPVIIPIAGVAGGIGGKAVAKGLVKILD